MSDSSDPIASLRAALDSTNLPPVHQWHPETTREIDMRIARNGDWFYQGSRIHRERMVRLFSTVLRCDDDGSTYLVTPQERLKIQVEDAPFTAVLLHKEGQAENQHLILTTNTGDKVLAGEHHPIVVEYSQPDGEPSPYILVRDRLRALISRSVFIELAQLAEPAPAGRMQNAQSENQEWGVYSDGFFMPLAEN